VDVSLLTRQWCCSSIFPGPSGLSTLNIGVICDAFWC
ncbi:MAG: hypothetical protein ACI92C_002621, partial [Neolewinella sp.]